jgi:hypothetical protein
MRLSAFGVATRASKIDMCNSCIIAIGGAKASGLYQNHGLFFEELTEG